MCFCINIVFEIVDFHMMRIMMVVIIAEEGMIGNVDMSDERLDGGC